ncbi:hypothetical protein D3C71_1352640 [compost metagenome]
MARGFQPVQAGHGDVEQDQVRLQLGAGVQRLFAVLGLGHHLDASLVSEQGAQALACQRFVVGDHHLQDSFLTGPGP